MFPSPSTRPPGRAPSRACSPRSSWSWPPARAPRAVAARRPPRRSRSPPPTPPPPPPRPRVRRPAPAFPVTLTDDEGTAVALATEPQKIVSLTPGRDRDPVRRRCRRSGRRHRRFQRLPGRGQAAARRRDLRDGRRREDRQPRRPTSSSPAAPASPRPTRSPSCARSRSRCWSCRATRSTHLQGHRPRRDRRRRDRRRDRPDDDDARRHGRHRGRPTTAESAKAATPPRVFYDVGYIDTTGQIYGPAKGSFLAEMLGMLGVDVITGDAVTYEIPLETLIERDPAGHHPGRQRLLHADGRDASPSGPAGRS